MGVEAAGLLEAAIALLLLGTTNSQLLQIPLGLAYWTASHASISELARCVARLAVRPNSQQQQIELGCN